MSPVAPRAAAGLALLAGLACARIEPPPGGPPDASPPRLIATRPDSFARVPGFKGDVEFRFDEVISEGGSPNQGTGTGDLEKLVILSPTTRVPDVTWRRSRITVRPSEGWRANRVYRVELLPGATDLRRNRSNAATVLTFTTGAPLPTRTVEATVVDWTTSRPVPGALVEAVLLPDSLSYRGVADSSGHIKLAPLPDGEYLVRGVLDQNRNFQFDGREAFDTARLAPGKTAAGELWAFVHDTTPPRIREVTVLDSISASIELSQSLDPAQRLAPGQVTVRILPDSTPIQVTSLLPKPLDDSLNRRAVPGQDSTARDTTARDTTGADTTRPGKLRGLIEVPSGPAPRGRAPAQLEALTSRPPLSDRLVLRVPRPWKPESRYEVEIRGIRTVSGVTGDVRGAMSVKAPAAADTTARGADSLKRRPPKKRS
ncbi:MAG: Ig-like domain-containing protein [Gemmatimonadales bacterium]